MMIGKFDEYFLPVLQLLEKLGPTPIAEIKRKIASGSNVTDGELEIQSEGGTPVFYSRVSWAVQYLWQAGALTRPNRGVYGISPLGIELKKKYPNGFQEKDLFDMEGFKAWLVRMKDKKNSKSMGFVQESRGTPDENIENALDQLETTLAKEIVARIQEMPFQFLEKTVLILLERMGYGDGSDSLKHIGGPNDGGVDGEIKQDRLGTQRIYVQAKRYMDGSNISRETLQAFIGALTDKGAAGGIFITTSSFTKEALALIDRNSNQNIALIDGEKLGNLLVENEVGAVVQRVIKKMEIDENFFLDK